MIVLTDTYPPLTTLSTTTSLTMNSKQAPSEHQQIHEVSFPSFIQSLSVGTACTTSTCSTALTNDSTFSTATGECSTTTALPDHFTPGPMDVVCARGKGSSRHEGNRRFKLIIENAIPKYANTDSRMEKTLIVSEIVESIRKAASPNSPGFVKKEGGRWWIMSDSLARDKVSQSLRDALSSKYRSSTKAKKRRRQAMSKQVDNDLDYMVQSTEEVSTRLQKLSSDLQRKGPKASNATVVDLFNMANCDLLETLKQNSTLVSTFTDRYNNNNNSTTTANNKASTAVAGSSGDISSAASSVAGVDDEDDLLSVTSV